jgi:hypothetical protein
MKRRTRVRTLASKESNQSPKEKPPFGRFSRRFYGIHFHGVISIGAPTPIRFKQTNRRLRHLSNSNHSRDGT